MVEVRSYRTNKIKKLEVEIIILKIDQRYKQIKTQNGKKQLKVKHKHDSAWLFGTSSGTYLANIGVEEDKALGISPLEDEDEAVQIWERLESLEFGPWRVIFIPGFYI